MYSSLPSYCIGNLWPALQISCERWGSNRVQMWPCWWLLFIVACGQPSLDSWFHITSSFYNYISGILNFVNFHVHACITMYMHTVASFPVLFPVIAMLQANWNNSLAHSHSYRLLFHAAAQAGWINSLIPSPIGSYSMLQANCLVPSAIPYVWCIETLRFATILSLCDILCCTLYTEVIRLYKHVSFFACNSLCFCIGYTVDKNAN